MLRLLQDIRKVDDVKGSVNIFPMEGVTVEKKVCIEEVGGQYSRYLLLKFTPGICSAAFVSSSTFDYIYAVCDGGEGVRCAFCMDTITEYTACQAFCPVLTRKRVLLLPFGSKGGPSPDDWTESLTLCILCVCILCRTSTISMSPQDKTLAGRVPF
jgi:hypothetical protein